MRDTLLLVGVAGLSIGILCRSFLFGGAALVVGLLLLGVLMIGAYGITRVGTYACVGVFMVLCALGVLRATFVPDTLPPHLEPLLTSDAPVRGTVVLHPDIRETTQRIVVEDTVTGARVLAVAPLFPEIAYGDLVEVKGIRRVPEAFDTDGGRQFDYVRFLAKDHIYLMVPYAGVTVTGEDVRIGVRVLHALYVAKRNFQEGLGQALPEPASSLAQGILVGGKQGLGKELLEVFMVAGLLPIVVLSGYNVMIVAEGVMRSLKFLPRRVSVSVALMVITAFVLAAGAGASAFRAGLMAAIALFARATHQTYDALRALLAVFVIMILWNPLLLPHDPGFQFSFAATLGLILFSEPIAQRLTYMRSAFVREITASTIGAQIAVLPLLLYQTGNFSLVSVPANMLALPVVPVAMALSALAGLVGMFVPPLAPLVGLPAYAALSYLIGIAQGMAVLPFAHTIIPAFPVVVLVCMYSALAAFFIYIKRNTPRTTSSAG